MKRHEINVRNTDEAAKIQKGKVSQRLLVGYNDGVYNGGGYYIGDKVHFIGPGLNKEVKITEQFTISFYYPEPRLRHYERKAKYGEDYVTNINLAQLYISHAFGSHTEWPMDAGYAKRFAVREGWEEVETTADLMLAIREKRRRDIMKYVSQRRPDFLYNLRIHDYSLYADYAVPWFNVIRWDKDMMMGDEKERPIYQRYGPR